MKTKRKKQYMVRITVGAGLFTDLDPQTTKQMIEAEFDHGELNQKQGIRVGRPFQSANLTAAWVVFNARDENELAKILNAYPMSKFTTSEIMQLAPYNRAGVVVP